MNSFLFVTLPRDRLGKEKRSQSEERGRKVFCPVCYFQSILQKMERVQRREVRVGKKGEKHLIQFVTLRLCCRKMDQVTPRGARVGKEGEKHVV